MKFLIQTINGEIKHDFSFTLIESINYQNWLKNDNTYITYELTDEKTEEGFIPIGSNEFVIKYLKDYYDLTPKPKNIPNLLLSEKYTCRKIVNINTSIAYELREDKFVKSNDNIKSYTEITTEVPIGNYMISDLIDIKSEYRCFVYKNELVGLQNYSGEFEIFPNIDKIKQIIETYSSEAPIAYTLDVGINDFNTFIIEIHDFFSCGLYGFANHKILPYMLSKWFYEYIKTNK